MTPVAGSLRTQTLAKSGRGSGNIPIVDLCSVCRIFSGN